MLDLQSMTMKEYATSLLEKVSLEGHLHQNVNEFSGGIGDLFRDASKILSTVGNNKLFFFDEPTASLDAVSKREVWVVIQELKKDSIVILTTHDMDEAEYLADQIIVLNRGKIRESGTVKTIKEKYQNIGQLKLVNPKSSTTPIGMDIVRAWVATIFGSTSVTSQSANSLTIQVLLNDVDILNNGLKLIATENIFEWQFKTSTVEDIYLSLNDLSEDNLKPVVSFQEFLAIHSINDAAETSKIELNTSSTFNWNEPTFFHQFKCHRDRFFSLVKKSLFFVRVCIYCCNLYVCGSFSLGDWE
jgi:ABC-type multidrug transport system ATPase subunit